MKITRKQEISIDTEICNNVPAIIKTLMFSKLR